MRELGVSVAILLAATGSVIAAPGDQWILGIHHINEFPGFTTYAGAGYSGPQSSGDSAYVGNAYGHSGTAGDISRVYWELSGLSVNNGDPVPSSTELYKIEYFAPTQGGHTDYQPVESQFHGIVGEGYPYEPSIPWTGQFGTNHQWISVGNFHDGQFYTMGPGPQTDTNSPANGTMMWLTAGSWLYAKWDFGFPVNRSWSALRLTQITPVASVPVTGDYNKNGVVDAADYVVWRSEYGQHASGLPADGYPDTYIDEYDYDVWRERFGNTSGGAGSFGASAVVPEPSTFALLALVVAIGFSVPQGRRRWADTR